MLYIRPVKIEGIIKKSDRHISGETERSSENLDLLLHAVEGINRTFELKELLKKCMNAASIVMNSEASSLMLLDEVSGELHVSIPTGPVEDDIVGLSIPKDKGVGGWVLKNNKPYISNNVSDSEFFWKDLSSDFETKNIICIPLQKSSGEAFGVLQAVNRKNGEDFTEEDIFVFESLGLHVSIAIERARKYDELVDNLEDYKVQLTEIHHRLKNNLATINALIELDLNDIPEGKSKDVLKVTGTRVKSVAEVHSLLYSHKNFGEIELSNYLNSIIRNVERIFTEPDKDITLHKEMEEMQVDTNKAMLCGLIVNELLINTYQHAFSNSDKGNIEVITKETEGSKKCIKISDDGIGFEEKKEEAPGKKSRGMFIVHALARKMKAELSFDNQRQAGSSCTIVFE